MPVRLRLVSKRTTPGVVVGFSMTVIGWPMAGGSVANGRSRYGARGSDAPRPRPQPVPWRTIVATVAIVAASLLAYELVRELGRIIAWLVVAGFVALVLAPAVDWVHHRVHIRRGLATAVVFLTVGMLF